jgi:hypothetical protein
MYMRRKPAGRVVDTCADADVIVCNVEYPYGFRIDMDASVTCKKVGSIYAVSGIKQGWSAKLFSSHILSLIEPQTRRHPVFL